METYVVEDYYNPLSEAIWMSTYNVGFYEELTGEAFFARIYLAWKATLWMIIIIASPRQF